MRSRYDVIISGARVAGSATARLLARAGLRVLVVERGRYGTDTLSTHALMRGAVLQLHRWGLLDAIRAAGTPRITTTAFHYGADVIRLPIKPRDGVDGLYAPRRFVLDRILEDAASAAGAEIVHRARVRDVLRSAGGRVTGAVVETEDRTMLPIAADLVIGADGVRSTVAAAIGAETYITGRHAAGVVYGYWQDLGIEEIRWQFGRSSATGVIPTNDGRRCIFAGVPDWRFRDVTHGDLAAGHARIVAELDPELARMLQSARRDGPLHGFAGVRGYYRTSWGPGWALVGDAGYFKDPITAHGITDALRDAELLARAVVRGSPADYAEYQAVRDDLSMGLFRLTDAIAAFDWELDALKAMHIEMSREMNREVSWLAELAPEAAAVVSAVAQL